VEGRADINARLISDDIISLPMEKELALYFIAQEALNNVLKHAKAKNIIVSLLNKKANFILKVDDDGCGFDPHTIYAGGIGLKSMRERAEQIGGKLKISSAPGKGTKIAVTLRNNFTLGDV
jgi:signal transduction histidine kinase